MPGPRMPSAALCGWGVMVEGGPTEARHGPTDPRTRDPETHGREAVGFPIRRGISSGFVGGYAWIVSGVRALWPKMREKDRPDSEWVRPSM